MLMGGPCPGRIVSLATGSILALLEPRGQAEDSFLEDSSQGHRGVEERRERNIKKAKNKGAKARHRGSLVFWKGCGLEELIFEHC